MVESKDPVLTPRLTALDERVLGALPEHGSLRLRALLAANPVLRSGDPREDVLGILRGLEAVGLASGRGGWWRRVAQAVDEGYDASAGSESIEGGARMFETPQAEGEPDEGELREEDVCLSDALDDREPDEELPGDES